MSGILDINYQKILIIFILFILDLLNIYRRQYMKGESKLRITIKLTDVEHNMLVELKENTNINVSSFIRKCIRNEYNRVRRK